MVDYSNLLWWSEGNFDNSFLYNVRMRKFDINLGVNLLYKLQNITTPNGDSIERKLVDALWEIPFFLEIHGQTLKEHITELEYYKYKKLKMEIRREISRILSININLAGA